MMKNVKIFLVSVILVCFLSLNAIAENNESIPDSIEYELPGVVVTANRYEKNVFETHVPVNIIRGRVVWRTGAATVGDLMEREVGVTYTNVGPWSQKVAIRGLIGPHVLTLVDGLPVNALRSYGNHAPLIDVSQIERVEIIRGPASILYGSEAVAGVVNYITRKPSLFNAGFAVRGNAGIQYNSVNQQHAEHLSVTGGLNNWSFLIGVNHRQADNVNTPAGELKNTGFSGYTFDGKLGFQPQKHHQFYLSAQLNRFEDVGVPINLYAERAKFLKYYRDFYTFSYEYANPGKTWFNSKLDIYFQKGERNFDAYLYHIPKGQKLVNQSLNAHRFVDSYGGSLQNSFRLFDKNLLIIGADVFVNFDDTERTADPEIVLPNGDIIDPPADLTPPTPTSNRKGAGVFLQNEFAPAQSWSFTFGARFDHIISQADATANTLAEQKMEKQDSDFSGNFGLLHKLSNNFHFTANIGRAFKAPTLQERFFKGTAQVGYLYGNPNLDSEISLNLDSGLKWQTRRLTSEFNIFRNTVDNYIVMKPTSANADTFRYDNVGDAELYGAEIQFNFRLTKHIDLFANSAYVHGQDKNADEPLPQIPPLKSRIGLRYEAKTGNYWAEMSSQIVNDQSRVTENEKKTGGYTLFNFSSGLNLQQIFRIRMPLYFIFNVHNIFDRSYRDHLSAVNWWDAPGRNISIGIRTQF